MNIRTFVIIIIVTLSGINCGAQNDLKKADDFGRIVLNSYISDQIDRLPSQARNMLKNKLSQIATKNGMGGSAYAPRFIITPNITVLTKDLTSTAPPMTAITLEVTFYIGDGIEGTKFASSSLIVKGVGRNEAKAYISAIKRISPNNEELQSLIRKGETRIIEYYNSRCDFILKEAKTLEDQNRFEEAILKLTGVPEVCKDCFFKCNEAVAPIYKKFIDRDCEVKLAQARNAWNAGQDYNAAREASYYLRDIEPNAACYGDAKSFSKEVADRIYKLDKREWDFEMKIQQDGVDVTKASIQGARDVGVAYGNNQPQNVTYNTKGWW